MTKSIQSFVHEPLTTISNEETFLQDKSLWNATWTEILSAGINIQSHTGV